MSDITPKPNESLDNYMKRFKRSVAQAGTLADVRKKEHALSKRQARAEKDKRNRRNKSKRRKNNNSGGGNYGSNY